MAKEKGSFKVSACLKNRQSLVFQKQFRHCWIFLLPFPSADQPASQKTEMGWLGKHMNFV